MEEFSSNGRVNANTSRFLNPWVLHFQKMGLELKCPLCLNFFDEPVLLPCNHLFCKGCMPFAAHVGSVCALCKAGFVDRDMRPAPFMDKMVSIYRSLDATFSTNMSKLVSTVDAGAAVEQSRFGQSAHYAASNCKEFEGCSMPVDCKRENLDIEGRKGGYGRHEDCRMPPVSQADAADQLSAGSPPSFGDGKVSDDSSDEYRGHGSKNASDRISIITNDSKQQLSKCTSSASKEEGHLRDLKRHKLDYGQFKLGISGADLSHPPVSEFGNSENSNSAMECKSQVTFASNILADADDAIVGNVKCAFCQSSKVTEDTGPVLHYMNGSLVVGVEAANPNVIHVHKLCVEWAPQAYYQGDDVHNLKAEVARGSKLKCNKCGLKGAALGCYLKSCQKSFHVPCALEVEECRWDMDNFLLLCPSHSSARFPDERSNSKPRKMPRNQASPFQINQQDSSRLVSSPDGVKKLTFCGSALSAEDRNILVKFAKLYGATVSKFWKPDVTHVIASTNENGACTRTYKVLMGILNGIWILNMDWVKACMKERRPLNEEAYEIALDNYGCIDGPKSGRLRVISKAPKLFTGLSFYFTGDFPPAYEDDLQDLIITAGGTVLENEELAVTSCNDQAVPKVLVVYNLDSPGGCKVGEEVSILWQRLNEAEETAAKVGAQVIGHTWLVESIAAGNLQPFVSC